MQKSSPKHGWQRPAANLVELVLEPHIAITWGACPAHLPDQFRQDLRDGMSQGIVYRSCWNASGDYCVAQDLVY